MRLSAPRVAPLQDQELTEEQREALAPMSAEGRSPINIFRTLARAPKALTRFNEWGSYVLSRRNSLPAREREIVILRVGFLCKSGYEFAQHERFGLGVGLTPDEIKRIKAGAAAGWSAADAALIRAADDLVGDHFVILKLGTGVLDKKRSDVTLDQLTAEMAGGQELEELAHELGR